MISAKRKGVGLNTGIEKADLKGMVRNRPGFANKLIKTLCRHDALPLGVDVDAMGSARCLAIDGHDKTNGLPSA